MPWTFPVGSAVTDSRLLALRVHLPDKNVTKTIQFEAQMSVAKACEHIRNQLRESERIGGAKEYGLFLPHEDNKKGLWLDNTRTLEHYMLHNGNTVEYCNRYRWLYIRTMDGTKKKLRVDDSQSVSELMRIICAKMGIYNHDEYSLIRELEESDRGQTMRRAAGVGGGVGTLGRDHEKMERLKRKLHTDDDMNWLNPSQSLRQQGISEDDVLLLKRRYFFSDMNIDARDPIQLNLLYVQLKDAILKGTHPVSPEEAVFLAAIQCQVQFGDHVQEKFKSNFIDLRDFLPKEYAKQRSAERKIFQQHVELMGMSEIDAKVKYCQFCRSLKTYGITFFLVKERIKGKNKLIPRLLGVTKDSVIRLDEKTKEVMKIWPLTSISRWAASLHAFTMDFGEYSPDDCYTAQTSEGEQISQLIAGYVDIITKKQKAKDYSGLVGDEESAMYEENVRAERATIIHHQRPTNRMVPVNGAMVAEHVIGPQQEDTILMAAPNGWSQYHIDGGDVMDTVDGQSMYPDGQRMSPDNFIMGGSHFVRVHELNTAQRALLHTINEDVQALQAAKEDLYLSPPDDQILMSVGSDETSKRWLSESIGASQAKVTDEMGAMNAAVAQALRSANRAETMDTTGGGTLESGTAYNYVDPADDLLMMQQSFRVVTIHFPAFVDDVKRVAVFRRKVDAIHADEVGQPQVVEQSEESTQNLLTAARDVADAFTNLFESARPLATGQPNEELLNGSGTAPGTQTYAAMGASGGPVSSSSRKAILEAASRVGEASNDLMKHVMDGGTEAQYEFGLFIPTEEDQLYKDELLALAKEVANATAGLVVKAKVLATQNAFDLDAQQLVIAAATQTGLCTSQLVACTKVLAPTVHQPSCQQQLSDAAREVAWAVDELVQSSRASSHSIGSQPTEVQQSIQSSVAETEVAATEVRDVLDRLNAHLLRASTKAYSGDALDNFQLAYENLQEYYTHDGQRMIASARRLAQATSQMISDIKALAEVSGDDPQRQSRLFAAAQQLVDATSDLINAAKVGSANPDNLVFQDQLREAAERLNLVAYSAAAEFLHSRLIRNLQTAARATVTGATQLVNVSRVATTRSRGNTYQVSTDANIVDSLIPRTVISIRESRSNPEDIMSQMELIGSCDRFVLPCEALVRSSRSIAPTLSDPSTQAALENCTSQLASAVEVLRDCLVRLAPLSRHHQLDGALARLARLNVETADIEKTLKEGTLCPLPNEKVDDCFNLLTASVQDATSSTTELQSVIDGLANGRPDIVDRPDVCGLSATGLASTMAGLVQATRGIVANEIDPNHHPNPATESARLAVTQNMRQAVQLAYELVQSAIDARSACDLNQPENLPTVLSHSEQLSTQLLQTLSRCLCGLPGHREISEAAHLIDQRRDDLVQLAQTPAPKRKVRWVEPVVYERSQSNLTQAAVEFNQATGDLLSSYSPGAFRRTTRRFSGAYDQLADRGIELSDMAPAGSDEHESQLIGHDLVDGLIRVSDNSQTLIQEASQACARPEEQNVRFRFQAAARNVTESISQLLGIGRSGDSPENRDCQSALRRLDALRPLLENPIRPVNTQNYYACVDVVAKSLAPLGESIRSIADSARERKTQKFGSAIQQYANSMCQLVEETAQAAYLIGLADPRSEPGRSSVVNNQLFIRIQKDIQQRCDALCDPSITHQQVISACSQLDRSAKELHEACLAVSAQTNNPDARQQLNQLMKETIQSIAILLQHQPPSTRENISNRQSTLSDTRVVSANVARLVHLVTHGTHFVGHAARVTGAAREAQQPVCSAGLNSLNSAQALLRDAQILMVNARSANRDAAYDDFLTTSKGLSDNMRVLAAALHDHAPGQHECANALSNIDRLSRDLKRAKMDAMEGRLQPDRNLNEEGFQKQLASSVQCVSECAPSIGRAARSEAEQLGHVVRVLDSYLPGLTSSAISAASRSSSSMNQDAYLEYTTTVLEATSQLMKVARDAGGNPRAVHLHPDLDRAVRGLMDSCQDLLSALDDVASQQGHVGTMVDSLRRSMNQIEEIVQVPVDARFADYQARLLRIARHMEQLNQTMQMRARLPSAEGELTHLAHTLSQEYQEMCQTCKGTTATLPDAQQADRLRAAVKAIGVSTINMVKTTTSGNFKGTDPTQFGGVGDHSSLSRNRSIADLEKYAVQLDSRLRDLIDLLETQGPLTQACLQSASTVSGIIADLDTTILFASSGTLHAPVHDDVDALLGPSNEDAYRGPYTLPGAGESVVEHRQTLRENYQLDGFGPIRESIARTARALVDDTQSLVNGTGTDQTRLASTAHVAVEKVTRLADVVKRGAAVIGPGQPDTQVEILTACRGTAVGLQDVFISLSKTPGRPSSDSIHAELRTNGQNTISNINDLLQKLKQIDDSERRGVYSLSQAAKYCRNQAAQLDHDGHVSAPFTPLGSHKSIPSIANISAVTSSSSLLGRFLVVDDLARAASAPVQSAVSKAILASNTESYSDINKSAMAAREVVGTLVTATKNFLRYTETPVESRNLHAATVKELSEEFALLLDALRIHLSPDRKTSDREKLSTAARRIANLSQKLLSALDSLKEGPRLIMYFRASSPEWRDVAEKYIGRHVAYHHQHVPSYAIAGPGASGRSTHLRPSCFPRSRQPVDDNTLPDGEPEYRIDSAVQQLEIALKEDDTEKQSTRDLSVLKIAYSVASAVQSLVRTIKSMGLAAPSEAINRARRASSRRKGSVWRTELTLSLVTQDLCQLALICSETTHLTDTTKDLFGTTIRLNPAKERLLATLRKVAAASAQLLISVKSNSILLSDSSDFQKLQSAGQRIKNATDKLSSSIQSVHFSCDSTGLYVTASSPPTVSNEKGRVETSTTHST